MSTKAVDTIMRGSVFAWLALATGALLARKVPRKYRWVIGGLVAGVFFYLWAELAVGVFTNLGS